MKTHSFTESPVAVYTVLLLTAAGWLFGCTSTREPAPVVEEPVLPESILPVVILSGSAYEMGYQQGQQTAKYIAIQSDQSWTRLQKSRTRDEVLVGIRAVQHFAQQYMPETIDKMKGLADGATAAGYDLSYTDILVLNSELPPVSDEGYPSGAESTELPPSNHCSIFSAWGDATKDGSLIGCGSIDATYGHSMVVISYPDEGNNTLRVHSRPGMVGNGGINNKGLFMGVSGGGRTIRPELDNGYGVNWRFIVAHIGRYANSATEAQDMASRFQDGIMDNYHFADVSGNAYVVESTNSLKSVRAAGDFGEVGFLYSSNNYMSDEMKVVQGEDVAFVKEHGGFGSPAPRQSMQRATPSNDYDYHASSASSRNMLMWDFLDNYHGQVDLEFAKMMWRYPGSMTPIPEGEWDPAILRPSTISVGVYQPDDGDEGVAYVSAGPVGRFVNHPVGGYPLIDGTHTFYRLTLASDPSAVVADAKATADADLRKGYKEFMVLKMTDPGFDVLNKLHSTAASEYYEGVYYHDKALNMPGGNDRLALLAKAATGYTRSQAHSSQLYEAFVAPADDPTDLGLRAFGGDWAQWETRLTYTD